jgi:hypothetical protein
MNYILLKELMKQSETECGFDPEKLAELIVRECIKQVFYTIEDEEEDNISSSIRDRIKQHFGVEE